MGWNLGKRALGALAGLMMVAGLAAPASAATTVTPNLASVPVGGNVSFTVSDDLFDLLAVDAYIGFDPALLQFIDAVPGSQLPGAGDPNNYFSAVLPDFLVPPVLAPLAPSFAYYTFAGSAGYTSAGPETIFTANFKALAPGTPTVIVAGAYSKDATPDIVTFAGFGSTTIAGVAAAPEPGTWLMMIIGFGLVGGVIRAQRGRRLAAA